MPAPRQLRKLSSPIGAAAARGLLRCAAEKLHAKPAKPLGMDVATFYAPAGMTDKTAEKWEEVRSPAGFRLLASGASRNGTIRLSRQSPPDFRL
jgi:hypothetical protein